MRIREEIMTVRFTIEGNPVAKGRHRSYINKGGRIGTYTPQKTESWENYIRMVARTYAPGELMTGPVKLQCMFYMQIPKSWSQKKKEEAQTFNRFPTTKPDLDNMVKLVKDALKGIIWHDDSQVVFSRETKFYSVKPRTEIYIEEMKKIPIA